MRQSISTEADQLGFADPRTPEDFERFIQATAEGELLEYTQGSTPRNAVSGRISTAIMAAIEAVGAWLWSRSFAKRRAPGLSCPAQPPCVSAAIQSRNAGLPAVIGIATTHGQS